MWEVQRGTKSNELYNQAASEINSFKVKANDSTNLVGTVENLLQSTNKNQGKTVVFLEHW